MSKKIKREEELRKLSTYQLISYIILLESRIKDLRKTLREKD